MVYYGTFDKLELLLIVCFFHLENGGCVTVCM
uniref:Uncharacterized protein n=1 Tax=Arundo donax TaxID=35708 RepID=A0A0A9KVY6_ARUDO